MAVIEGAVRETEANSFIADTKRPAAVVRQQRSGDLATAEAHRRWDLGKVKNGQSHLGRRTTSKIILENERWA
jgi:hypothetical protein